MSRIGKLPIPVPSGVEVKLNGRVLHIKGKLGEETLELLEGIDLDIQDGSIQVIAKDAETDKKIAAFFGLSRSLINNIVVGVSEGFEKALEIIGVGYRANQQGQDIQFQLGYSHPILFKAPQGITLEVVDANNVKVKGANKQQVGQVAANIRELRPPEPYKGKGIRYKGEYVRKKAGKAGK